MTIARNWGMHYYVTRMWVIGLVFIISASCFLNAQTDGFPESVKRAKESIVPVACATWPDESHAITIKEIEGTGFFVNYGGNFITAAHVINDHFRWYTKDRPSADCFPVIYLANPTWLKARWFQFHACISDTNIDVAVCKTVEDPVLYPELHVGSLRLSSKTTFDDGTPVAFTGFPQNILVPITSKANIAAVGEFFVLGRIDIVIDKTNWHGISGAPLYLSDGTVIGMMRQRGEGLWDGLAFARDMAAILKFLKEHNITVADDLPAEKKRK